MSRAIGNLTARSKQGHIRAENQELATKLLLSTDSEEAKRESKIAPEKKTHETLSASAEAGGSQVERVSSDKGDGDSDSQSVSRSGKSGTGRKSVKRVAFEDDVDSGHFEGEEFILSESGDAGKDLDSTHSQSGPNRYPRGSSMSDRKIAVESENLESEAQDHGGSVKTFKPGASVTWDSEDFSGTQKDADDSQQKAEADRCRKEDNSPSQLAVFDEDNGLPDIPESDTVTVVSTCSELARLRSPSRKSLNAGDGATPPPSSPICVSAEKGETGDVEPLPAGGSGAVDDENHTDPAPATARAEETGGASGNTPGAKDTVSADENSVRTELDGLIDKDANITPTNEEDNDSAKKSVTVREDDDGDVSNTTPTPGAAETATDATAGAVKPAAVTDSSAGIKPTPTFSQESPRGSRSSFAKQTLTPRSTLGVEDDSLNLESNSHPRFTVPYSSQRLKPRGETAKRQAAGSLGTSGDSVASKADGKEEFHPRDSLEGTKAQQDTNTAGGEVSKQEDQIFSGDSLDVEKDSLDISAGGQGTPKITSEDNTPKASEYVDQIPGANNSAGRSNEPPTKDFVTDQTPSQDTVDPASDISRTDLVTPGRKSPPNLSLEEHEKDLPGPDPRNLAEEESVSKNDNFSEEEKQVEFVIRPDPNKQSASRYSSAQGSGRFSTGNSPAGRRASLNAAEKNAVLSPERRRSSGAAATPSGRRIYVESPTFTREEEEEYRYVSSRLDDVEEEDGGPSSSGPDTGRLSFRRGKYTYKQPNMAAIQNQQQQPHLHQPEGRPQPAASTAATEKRVRYSDMQDSARYEDRDRGRLDRGPAFPVDPSQGAYSQAGKQELKLEAEFPLSKFSMDTRGQRPGLTEEVRMPPAPAVHGFPDSANAQTMPLQAAAPTRDSGFNSEDPRARYDGNKQSNPAENSLPQGYIPNMQGFNSNNTPQDHYNPNYSNSQGYNNRNSNPQGHSSGPGYPGRPTDFDPQTRQRGNPQGFPNNRQQNDFSQQQQEHYGHHGGYSQQRHDQRFQPNQQSIPPPLPQQQHQPPQQQQQQQKQEQRPPVKGLELPTGPSYDPADEQDLERETTYQQGLRNRIEEVKRQAEGTHIPRLPLATDPQGYSAQGQVYSQGQHGYSQGYSYSQPGYSQGYSQVQGQPRYVPGSEDFAADSLDYYEERDGQTLRALEEAFGASGGGAGGFYSQQQRQQQQHPTNHFRNSDQYNAPMDSGRDPRSYGGGTGLPRQPQSRLDNVNLESDDFRDDYDENFRQPRRNPQVQPRFFNPDLAAAVSVNNYSNNSNAPAGGGSDNNNNTGIAYRGQRPQQQYTERSEYYDDNSTYRENNNRYEDENDYSSIGGGGGDVAQREDSYMEASHPKPPKYDYVSHNKEDYGKAPPKSYSQIREIKREEKEKLSEVFIQPKAKGAGILKKKKARGSMSQQGQGQGDGSRQGSLYSGDGSYLEESQTPGLDDAEGMSAAEQVWARRSSQLAGNKQGSTAPRGRRGGRGAGGHGPGLMGRHHSDSSINQAGNDRRENVPVRQRQHQQQPPPPQQQQQQQPQQQRQVAPDKRAFITDLPTPVNEQLTNQVAIPISPRHGEIQLQPVHQQIITEDGQRISVDVNLRLISPPPYSSNNNQAGSASPSNSNAGYAHTQQQQPPQPGVGRARQYPANTVQYSEEELLGDFAAVNPLAADYRYISPRGRYSADEVLRALTESRTELNPYGKVPPIDDAMGRGYRDGDHPTSAPIPDQGGSYMDAYMKQRDKSVEKPWYKVYGLRDYRKMQKEVKLGTLGPDLDSDATRERREKAQRQQEYAKVVMEKNRTELVHKKPPAFPRPKENDDIMNRRKVAQEYAKSVPKPTVRIRPNEYNNYKIASEKSPIAKHHRQIESTATPAGFGSDSTLPYSPSGGAVSITPGGGQKISPSPQHQSRPGGREKEMEVLDLERLRQRYEQDKQNEAAIRQTSGRTY